MSSLLELIVVLPLLLSVVVMDNASMSAIVALHDDIDRALGDYSAILYAVDYTFEGSTGNRYPHGGGSLCASDLP